MPKERTKTMSNQVNEDILEQLFQKALETNKDPDKAEAVAMRWFEDLKQ